jgi:hypothetical protein
LNIFEIITSLYEEKDTKWIETIIPEDLTQSHPIVINKLLAMNPALTWQLPVLNDYAVVLDTRKFLFVAWAMLPKGKAPYCKYIKPVEDEEFDFMWNKFKRFTGIMGNDFKASKKRLEKHFKENMREWFSDLGVEKSYWKKYGIELQKSIIKTGLGGWF